MDINPFDTPDAPYVAPPAPAANPEDAARREIAREARRTKRGRDLLVIPPAPGLLVQQDSSTQGGSGLLQAR